jgi:hypothetical protein
MVHRFARPRLIVFARRIKLTRGMVRAILEQFSFEVRDSRAQSLEFVLSSRLHTTLRVPRLYRSEFLSRECRPAFDDLKAGCAKNIGPFGPLSACSIPELKPQLLAYTRVRPLACSPARATMRCSVRWREVRPRVQC